MPPQRLRPDHLESTPQAGGAPTGPGGRLNRQQTHDDVHYALGHVPEPREPSDPRAHFLDRFLRTTLGFLPRVLSGAVLQAMFLFPLSAGYGRNVLVVNLQSLMFVLAATV